ncbi:NUDIX hydrolase [Stackebrandtia nassauensis]|uniref:NUDIX hydrolase n=1 Tax=Stackebrandtia nassauensis (strain DSM 44728 / CIP 108903 / NRRL B-16338 / NBRC 102104 / LLR-40K-21) TaxID=446470 RepID=D3Q4W3_STANL|nr:NUDIX domain-containing protein [Stackebrandtia nassauensis]ADD42143.1 NUDIX hydrolase [Stackebrandtia nassauensis DSM 44728]
MSSMNFRHAVRAIILDERDRVLLCRFVVPDPPGTMTVWVAPGGGVDPGETRQQALRRELMEEVGLALETDPPLVWNQKTAGPEYTPGYDGTINDYYLVRASAFDPRGTFTDEQLAAENIAGWRWWPLGDIVEHDGADLFSPRDLATPLAALIADGVPARPVSLGL